MSDLSEEDQERLRQIRINTAEIIGKVGLLNTEVTEKVEQLEAKSELLKLQKLSEQLSKKEEEIEKSQYRLEVLKKIEQLEKEGKYREQERMLRHRRNIILDTIHDGEKLLGNLDYLLFTITKKINH